MAKRGAPGYGKMKNLKDQVDKFSPLFWQIMEEFGTSKSKEDKKFFIQEFNKIQTKMIPQAIDGDGEGGAIKVTITNYGSPNSVQLPTEGVSTTFITSD
jgi:hypothetical protein